MIPKWPSGHVAVSANLIECGLSKFHFKSSMIVSIGWKYVASSSFQTMSGESLSLDEQ